MQLRRRQDGVTLVEVLVAITILGVIVGPLAGALIVYLRNTDDIGRRLSESHDAQIAAAYFAQDVQSVGIRDWTTYPYPLKQSIELNVPPDGGINPCGDPSLPNALVRFAWDEPPSASGAVSVVRVAYVVETVGAQRQLHRIRCDSSGVTDTVVAHNVDTVAPAVTCSSTCTAAPAVPASVTMTLQIKDPTSTGQPLIVTLTGQRRQT